MMHASSADSSNPTSPGSPSQSRRRRHSHMQQHHHHAAAAAAVSLDPQALITGSSSHHHHHLSSPLLPRRTSTTGSSHREDDPHRIHEVAKSSSSSSSSFSNKSKMKTALLMGFVCAAVWSLATFAIIVVHFYSSSSSLAGTGSGQHETPQQQLAALLSSSSRGKSRNSKQQEQDRTTTTAGATISSGGRRAELEEQWKRKEAALLFELQALENIVLKQERATWQAQEAELKRQIQEYKKMQYTTNGRVEVARAQPQQQQQQQQQAPVPVPNSAAAVKSSLLPQCRVSIENRFHFHLEVVESAALLHPFPWNDWQREGICDTSRPAAVDLALGPREGRFFLENPSFETYFRERLRHQTFPRRNGDELHSIRYGDMVDYDRYNATYHAVIGVSCSESTEGWVEQWLRASKRHSCILHRQFYVPPDLYDQTCFVHPAWRKLGRCMYLPSAVPQFDGNDRRPWSTLPRFSRSPMDKVRNVTLCVTGARRAHSLLAVALRMLKRTLKAKMRPDKNLVVHILMREFEKGSKTVRGWYEKTKVSEMIQTTIGADFMRYERILGTSCHAILPLVDPEKNPMYFVGANASSLTTDAMVPTKAGQVTEQNATLRLSGSIIKAVGYRIPILIHKQLETIYHDYWTAPVYSYTTVAELNAALQRFLRDVGAFREQ